jgi:hypothetical protein
MSIFKNLQNKFCLFLKNRREINCRKGSHSWTKNPNWYSRDKYGNQIFQNKTEFVDYQGWCEEIYYCKCAHCGHTEITRTRFVYD